MFSVLNDAVSPRIDKELYDIVFTGFNPRDNDALIICLEKSDPLEVYRMVEEVNKELNSVKLENIVLSDFLQKNDPKLLIGLDRVRQLSIDSRNSQLEKRKSQQSAGSGLSTPNLARAESRTISIADSGVGSIRRNLTDNHINYRTKVEIAEKLAAEIQKTCEVLEAKGTNEIKLLKGQIEELNYHCADTEGTIRNFEKQFLNSNAVLGWTEKQKENNFRKFINNWLKNGRALLGTMRLKITSVQERCHQQRTSLISKADLSGMLGPVDFELLQMKREDQNKILDEKNASLNGLKEVTGKASLALAKERKILLALEQQYKTLVEKSNDLAKSMVKLEQETIEMEKELEIADDALKNIKNRVEEYEAPSITQYISIKGELTALEKEEKLLWRTSYIQNIKLKNLTKKLRALE